MLPGGIRQGTDCPEMLSALGNRPMGGARGEKGVQLPRPLFANWLDLWGAVQQARAPFAHSPTSHGVEGHRIPSTSRDSTLSSLPRSLQSLCPPVPIRGWSTARVTGRCSWGRPPTLSKATIEKNLDLQGMWVTICCTLALLTLQNHSPTLYDILPDPRGGGGGGEAWKQGRDIHCEKTLIWAKNGTRLLHRTECSARGKAY